MKRVVVAIVLSILFAGDAHADDVPAPMVWGPGVSPCSDYDRLYQQGEKAPPNQAEGLQRYRDWFTGLVTGLSLATGTNMLYGTSVDEAMERINIQCSLQPSSDLFNAAVLVLQRLSTEGLTPAPRKK